MRRKRQLAIFMLTSLVAISPGIAMAAGLSAIVPSDCNGVGGCQSICDLAQIASNLLTDAIYIAVFFSAILFAWAGLKMLTSVANPSGRTAAKSIFANVALGLVIILASWLLVETVMRVLLNASLLPWNSIC